MPHARKFRVGSLNVQGFADTLKLKNALQLMQEHRLDVLMLTKTRSNSYYSYISEQHLVILSGNNCDKFAGVGAIISPTARPHLLDVIQVNNRILHLAFAKFLNPNRSYLQGTLMLGSRPAIRMIKESQGHIRMVKAADT